MQYQQFLEMGKRAILNCMDVGIVAVENDEILLTTEAVGVQVDERVPTREVW